LTPGQSIDAFKEAIAIFLEGINSAGHALVDVRRFLNISA
jgi:hypothetical protein